MSQENLFERSELSELTLLQEERLARTLALQDSDEDLPEPGRDYSLSLPEWSANSNRLLSFGKTSQEYLAANLDEISQQSSVRWRSAGRVTSRGEFLTLDMPDWHNDASECFLWEILVENAPDRYYLTPKACAGILRRAEKRGKTLPERLREALESVAQAIPTE